MGNPVVYFEIAGPASSHLLTFYGELFGWRRSDVTSADDCLVDTCSGAGINGRIGQPRAGRPWATFYVEVDDLQETMDRAVSGGGAVIEPATDIPQLGSCAVLADPDGLAVGLIASGNQANSITETPSEDGGTPVTWFEVMGSDAQRSQRFYSDLFGWTAGGELFAGFNLVELGSDRGIHGGIGTCEWGRWATIYARVANPGIVLKRAEELGASPVFGPVKVSEGMAKGIELAAFRDQAGNIFGLFNEPSSS